MKEKSVKKSIFIIICLLPVLLCMTITGCVSDEKGNAGQASEAGKIVSETKQEMTIVDQAGREVTVKKDPKSIALCYRVVIRFLLSLDQGDKIRGIGKSEPFLEELQPSLKDCMDVGKGVADIEALAELEPDLFIHKASDVETLEAVEGIGIPSIGIEVETPEDMLVALRLLGKVCGAEEKADKLERYYSSKLENIGNLTKDLSDKERPKAIVMGTSIGKVADGSMLQGRMLEMAGGINCARDLEATELWPTAGTEQIFEWDPEYIFITNSESAVYSEKDIMEDPAWSQIKAVKEGHVYTMPAKSDSWEFPGVVSVLGIDYMMSVMHPDLIDDRTLEQNVEEFYKLSYDRTFDRKELGF